MLCSLQPRNALIILSVLITHLLVFLLFTYPSFNLKRTLASDSIMVDLVNLSVHQPNQSKNKSISKPSAIAPTENLKTWKPEDSSNSHSGGGLGRSLSSMPRQALHNPKPNYPFLSRKLREQGLVMIRLCINQNGFVEEASVSKSSGFQGLDKSALVTLSQWRFLPDSSSRHYSSQCFQAPIQFSLEG